MYGMNGWNKPDGDLISRAAAIAIADSSDYVGLSVDDVKKVTDEVVKGLKQLPSAQPEQQWIPCSERLPKEYGNYLITKHNGDVDVGTIDPKKKGVWSACDADGFYWIREVVAWMPLPEPYKEEKNE